MDTDDLGEVPDLDEITLLRLPPPDPAQRIVDERLERPADEPEPEEEEPWWRQETGG